MVEDKLGMKSQFDMSDYVSKGVPQGHNTVWGFLAQTEPASLYLMSAPGSDVAPVETRIVGMAKELGIEMGAAIAPSLVQETGGPKMCATFPSLLLRLVLGRDRAG